MELSVFKKLEIQASKLKNEVYIQEALKKRVLNKKMSEILSKEPNKVSLNMR